MLRNNGYRVWKKEHGMETKVYVWTPVLFGQLKKLNKVIKMYEYYI